MKKTPKAQWVSVLCLLSGLAWGGNVSVTPDSKTYLQTELTVGTPVTLPITLSDWGTTNLTVTASGGGTIFSPSVVPSSSAPQTTDRVLSLLPQGVAGSATVFVKVSGSGITDTSNSVSLTVTAVPVISGLSATASFSEDTTYSDSFNVTYWGSAASVATWQATIVTGGGVLQTATITGSGLTRTLVLTPKNNKNGSASVRVVVSDGIRSDTNTVSVTVNAVVDPPDVQGLPSTLSFKEDTSTNVVFTVTDLDEGSSGPITSSATVAGGSSSLLSTVSVSDTTLHLVPAANAYGWATVRVITANNTAASTNDVLVRVQPVADASVVSSWPTTPIELNVGEQPVSQPFTVLSVSDADHLAFKNGTSNEYLKASLSVNNPSILFSSGNGSSTTNLAVGVFPANVTTWLRSLALYPPESTYAPVGNVSTNTLKLIVYGVGSNDTLSVTSTVSVLLVNPNHPPQFIPTLSQSSLQEGQTITPFSITQVMDQDAVHTAFSLNLFIKQGDGSLASLSSSSTMHGNQSELNTQLRNVGLIANSGVMSTATTNVTVYYVLSDSIAYVTNSVTLTINQNATAPVINGISEITSYYSVSDIETVAPFPNVITYDTDQGGRQWLRASFTVSSPGLGSFTWQDSTVTSFSSQPQTNLQENLRGLLFVPTEGALPIGTSAEVTLTLTVVDVTGLSAVNSSVRVLITAVNKPPRIVVPQVQPVLLPPGGTLRPFAGTAVTNDDSNNVKLTITLDDDSKGTLGNLGGFTYSEGSYSMFGSLAALNASLTNITYAVNQAYLFPADDPGGTLFSLEAEDYQIKLGLGTVWVQVQDEPKNHLVTKRVNDGTPGTLQFALLHASNNDVITFALPDYPAVIAIPNESAPLVLGTSLTIKGPGADLLTISGDSDGDGDSDGQIFVVQSRVTIEGVTLSHGHATYGGAVSVAESGMLTLRACAVQDCEAEEYGGAIDVEGALFVEGCSFERNRVMPTGFGGGAVSFYTAQDSAIVNTTFSSNRLENAGGYGGGAVYVERNDAIINVDVMHCTFAGNSDASCNASALYVVGGNTYATLKNNVFSDYSAMDGARNIDVTGEGWIVSLGGNICDDTTRTTYLQGGGTVYYLLTNSRDKTGVEPGLGSISQSRGDTTRSFPLQAGSPAVGGALGVVVETDQRGLIRRGETRDSGAVEQDATERVTITEIQLSTDASDTDPFVEVYVPRDGQDVDLTGFKLYVNGVAVHEFGQGRLALTNSVYPALTMGTNVPASSVLTPGRGVVIVFPKGAVADFLGFSAVNPTPVVRGSIITNAAGFGAVVTGRSRGSVAIARSDVSDPVVFHTFLTDFIDPEAESGTNLLATTHNSIASAPQAHGFAFLPHSSVSADMFGGWRGMPTTVQTVVLLTSPGATVAGAPFGLRNATPIAVGDNETVTEDDLSVLDVLANDLDADGNDRLVIVDVSTGSAPLAGDSAGALSSYGAIVTVQPSNSPLRATSLSYDPRGAVALQALPAGTEILDTFHYEVIDIGSAAVDGIDEGPVSNIYVTAKNHRLVTGDSVVLSRVSVSNYNGTFTISVIDENTFAVPVTFVTAAAELGMWETDGPRNPSARSEATVTVRVTGVNDEPTVGGDIVTNVTEASVVRIMVRPELANMVMSLAGDPVPPPVPNLAHLIDNDADIDADDTWQTLRLVGVMGGVHAILDYTGTPTQVTVTIRSPSHGLSSGTEILIANYGGHPSYNGYHTVTVLDNDTFTIPQFFVDNDSAKGVWVVLTDSNRYHAVTDVGATVDLTLRADIREDHLIYNAATSSFLNGLAEGERYTNRFYQAVADSHGAIGIGPVDIVVVGLNDTPTAPPDPDGLSILTPLVNSSNSLENVLSEGLDILYTLPPASCTTGRIDVQALDRSGTLSGTLVLSDLWFTDEGTPISIEAAALLANDTDIDRIDVLSVTALDAFSREGASLTLGGGQITYDPTSSEALQALARDERVIDTFYAAITDTMTGGTVTSLVAVLVVGLNDTPVAQPDFITLSEDDIFTFNPILYPVDMPALHDYDLDIDGVQPDDRLTLLVVSNLITTGEARVDIQTLSAQYNATVSGLLNQLADWQSYTDSFPYAISDNSFLFVVDDEFYVPADTVGRTLDVLANDRDFTQFTSTLTIVDAGPTLRGGTVTIAPDGRHLVYSSPEGLAVDDFFRYVVENEVGNRRSARVLVRSVIPQLNGVLSAADDHFAVAYGETTVLDVLFNDNMMPANESGLVLSTNVVETSIPGQPVVSGNRFVYTATNGLSPLTFIYEVSAGGASVARAAVVVDVVDRRGTLKLQNDTLSVLAGSTTNTLDVLSNDNLITGATNHLRIAELLDPAAFGLATTNALATALVYTPNPSFMGVEQLRYLATDGIGGTGTGVVTVIVGKVDTAIDFFTVAATTNAQSVSLDVLANDLVQPFPTGGVTLVSVSPENTAIGTIQVNGAGTRLEFVPSNVVGQVDVVYQVADSSGRSATGMVTVATVPAGIYANTDRFLVRKGGSNYELNVLANDRSYPDVNKSYSILSIGAGAEAPSEGGSVSIVGNTLRYTPRTGFSGQERFTYMMSDSINTDSAWVTVTVSPGDLFANEDHYSVFYELDGASTQALAFTLPVVVNDRIQPPLGQVIQITGLGVGTNAPNHLGEVSVGEDGRSLVYRPVEVPATSYVERFTYEISDGTAIRTSAAVEVQVFNREGELEALTQDDVFTVARNSTNNTLPVLQNDFVPPGTAAGWTITEVSVSAYGGAVSNISANVRYTPPADFVGVDTFTYSVSDGLGGTGSAMVRVRVGEKPTLADLFTVVSGSVSNELDVLANDVLTGAYADEYTLESVFGATQGGAVERSSANTVIYTPDALYTGPYPYTETFAYTVPDDAGGAVTGTVQVVVHEMGSDQSETTVTLCVEGRNDIPVINNTATNLTITDKQTALPFTGVTVIEVDQQTVEPIDVTVSLDNAAKGTLQDLGDFTDLGGGQYGLIGVTAADATAQIRSLLFVPTENRITVPTTEATLFTVSVTDNKSTPVVNTQSVINVTAVNDPPVITGTRSGQTVYAATAIRLFSSVTVHEIDDLMVQPLDITIRMSDPTHGILQNLGSFSLLSNGVYGVTGITAETATQQLRLMEFVYGVDKVDFGAPQLTVFQLSVSDRFALPVIDNQTSVLAYNAFEDSVEPNNSALRDTFGEAVDIWSEFAVVGIPGSDVSGSQCGSALVYRLVPGTTNTWVEWRQLQPVSVDADDRFGTSVSIGENLIAVGAIRDETNGIASGAVYVFERNQGGSNNWGLVKRIAPTNLPVNSAFGTAVDLDGDWLAVGAPKATISGAPVAPGAVFLYERNNGGSGVWGEIVRREPSASSSLDFGRSVSLSGSHLVVGAPKNTSTIPSGEPRGATYYLSRYMGGVDNWGFVQRIVVSNFTYAAGFGYSVSVDGNTLAVGAPDANTAFFGAGLVYLYRIGEWSNGWSSVTSLVATGNQTGERFGYCVSVNKDFVFIGAPNGFLNIELGSAYLFRRDLHNENLWNPVERFSGTYGSLSDGLFGTALSFKRDCAIVGAINDLTLPSKYLHGVYIYRFKFNNAPVLTAAVPDQTAEWNQPFTYTLPEGLFADPDVNDSLTLLMSLPAGGFGLGVTDMTVSGTPTMIGPIPVDILATDDSESSASDTFNVVVLVNGTFVDPTPRNIWNVEHFGIAVTDPLLQSSLWGGNANGDGDELINDQEYVFGGNPTVGDLAGQVLITSETDDQMIISYVRRKDDPGLNYVLQGTSSLLTAVWEDIQTLVIESSVVAIDESLERVNQKIRVADTGPTMFFRVLVTH
jgi:VCBS repeat-containing protein